MKELMIKQSKGWGKKTWSGPTPIGLRSIPSLPDNEIKGGESVQFKLHSSDGDEGFPGTIDASAIYTSGTQTSSTSSGKQVEVTILAIEYEATLVDGEETCINMTNHSYVHPTISSYRDREGKLKSTDISTSPAKTP